MSDWKRLLLSSHRVGRVLGIEVRVLYVLYLVTALLGFHTVILAATWGAPLVLLGLVPLLLLPVFVFLHEMGHSLAALKEGVNVRRILLTPIGGVAQLEGTIPGPMAEIVIALAGPFASLLLAAVAALPLLLGGGAVAFGAAPGGGVLSLLLSGAVTINLLLALFNLLPIFPLDGGRVALAAAVLKLGPSRGIAAMRRIAFAGVVGLGLLGLLSLLAGAAHQGLMLILIAVFLHMAGRQEMQARLHAERYLDAGGAPGGLFPARTPWEVRYPWEEKNLGEEEPFDTFEGKPSEPGLLARWRDQRRRRREAKEAEAKNALDAEVDRILAKVKEEGIARLTPEERDLLNRASRSYR